MSNVTVRAIRDYRRATDQKRIAIEAATGSVESEDWGNGKTELSVTWEGHSRKTNGVPKDILVPVMYGIWSPREKTWLKSRGEPATFPSIEDAAGLIDEGDALVVAEYFDGPWAPPTPYVP